MRLFFRYLSHRPAKCWQSPQTSRRCMYLMCPILQRVQDRIQATLTDASPRWVVAVLRQWEMKLQLRSGVSLAEFPCYHVCFRIYILSRRHISSWAMPHLKNPDFLTAFLKPPDRGRGLSVGQATTASSSSVLDVTGGGKNLSLQKVRMESAIASETAGRGTLARHEAALDRYLVLRLSSIFSISVTKISRRMFDSKSILLKPRIAISLQQSYRSIWK